MIKLSENKELVEQIKKTLKENGGYCPCTFVHNDDTKCMCKEFRDAIKKDDFFGSCHCGLYEKIRDN